jgi:hypothetical protein
MLFGNYPNSKLASIFSSLVHLKRLFLDLEGIASEQCRGTDQHFYDKGFDIDSQSAFSQLFPSSGHFPSLKSLNMCGLFATEDELVHFLERHASTLLHLHLNGAILARPNGQDVLPCWMRTLKRVQKCLNLKLTYLESYFMNGSTQNWCVWDERFAMNGRAYDWWNEDGVRKESIKSRMEAFIVHAGECPLEYAAAEYLESAYFEGDPSWCNKRPTDSTYDEVESDFAGESEASDWDSEGEYSQRDSDAYVMMYQHMLGVYRVNNGDNTSDSQGINE